jgi:gamma-glutamylcyclotransferase (GGCT)/AIG2-like uncharacterized protein YtfP
LKGPRNFLGGLLEQSRVGHAETVYLGCSSSPYLMRDHLFSYGLFKKGQPLHTWLSKHCEPRLVGPATLSNATLIDLGEGFVGLKNVGKTLVQGELYSLPWQTILEIRALIYRDTKHIFSMERLEFGVGGVTMDAYTFIFKGFKDHPRFIKAIKSGVWI